MTTLTKMIFLVAGGAIYLAYGNVRYARKVEKLQARNLDLPVTVAKSRVDRAEETLLWPLVMLRES